MVIFVLNMYIVFYKIWRDMGIPMTRYSLLSKLMRKGQMPAPSSRSARCPGLEKEVEREARDI